MILRACRLWIRGVSFLHIEHHFDRWSSRFSRSRLKMGKNGNGKSHFKSTDRHKLHINLSNIQKDTFPLIPSQTISYMYSLLKSWIWTRDRGNNTTRILNYITFLALWTGYMHHDCRDIGKKFTRSQLKLHGIIVTLWGTRIANWTKDGLYVPKISNLEVKRLTVNSLRCARNVYYNSYNSLCWVQNQKSTIVLWQTAWIAVTQVIHCIPNKPSFSCLASHCRLTIKCCVW